MVSVAVFQMAVQRALHDGQTGSYSSLSLFRIAAKDGKNYIQLMARDIFQLSCFSTLHFLLVKHVQLSFCTLGGVLVLVFAC